MRYIGNTSKLPKSGKIRDNVNQISQYGLRKLLGSQEKVASSV